MSIAYSLKRDEANYVASLKESIKLSPYTSYTERLVLTTYYQNRSMYPELKDLVIDSYRISQTYIGSQYAIVDPDFNKNINALRTMLLTLQNESLQNQDRDTFIQTKNTLKLFN
jgi:hypothetical protein